MVLSTTRCIRRSFNLGRRSTRTGAPPVAAIVCTNPLSGELTPWILAKHFRTRCMRRESREMGYSGKAKQNTGVSPLRCARGEMTPVGVDELQSDGAFRVLYFYDFDWR